MVKTNDVDAAGRLTGARTVSSEGSKAWTGRARLGSFWALHRGAIGDNELHAHHALQFTAVSGVLSVSLGGKRIATPGIFIASMRRHKLAAVENAGSLYVDAASPIGRGLSEVFASRSPRLDPREVAVFNDLDVEAVSDAVLVSRLGTLFGLNGAQRPLDARLMKALAVLEADLEESSPSLRQLSNDVQLSEGRLSRLFHREMGMPYRPYRRWRRVQQALNLLERGANLTEAAIGAGFSDSAHFSRTFRQLFGVTPSAIAPLVRRRTADSFKP